MDNIQNIKLFIDNRESKLINHFKDYDFVECKTLDIGDLMFLQNDKPLLIIERKTINDLASSIMDGRYREQKQRLFQSGCNFIYLIEGGLKYHKYKNTVIGSICNLLFRDDIKVIKTFNIEESILYIKKLCIKFNKGEFEQKAGTNIQNYKIKKKDCYKPQDCFKLQLNLIPRVSINLAKTLSDEYKTMNNFILFLKQNGKSCLKDMEYNTGKRMRKVGNKLSNKIYDYLIDYN